MASPAPEPPEEDDDNDSKPLFVNQLHATPPSTLISPTRPQMRPPATKRPPGLTLNEAHSVQFVGGEPTLAQEGHSNGAPYHHSPPPPEVPGSAMRVTQSLFPQETPPRHSQAVIDRDESSSGDEESEGDTEDEDDDDDDDNERSRGPELRGRPSGSALARAQQARAPQAPAPTGNRPPRIQQPAAALEFPSRHPLFPHRDTTPTPVPRNRDPPFEPSQVTAPVIGRRNGTAHDPSKRHSFQSGQLPSSVVGALSADHTTSPPTRPKRHSTTSRPVSSHGHNSPLNLLVRIPGQQVSTPSPLTAPPAVSHMSSDNATQESGHTLQALQDFDRSHGRGLKKKGSVSSINSAATVPVGKSPPTAIREDVIATIIPLSKTSSSSSSTAMLSNLAQKRHSMTSTSGPFAGLTLPGFGYGHHHHHQPHPRDSSLPSEIPLVSQFYPPNARGPHVFSLLETEDLRRHLTATMYRQPMTEAYERVCAARHSATNTKRT